MKLLKATPIFAVLIGLGLSSVGCSTPAYSGRERWSRIGYNISYEAAQMQDDIDHALMLRPGSKLTLWNVQAPD
jgi:hypothetical protein